ncbi:MAG TPA: type II toxin-antitoxin system Phd/YefM family antitoxin [Ktedonobacteraceae bacterium]
MARYMSSKEAREHFSDLLGSVYYTKEPVIIEKKGKSVAVVISPEQYEAIQKEEERLWRVVDQIRDHNIDNDPNEVLRDVTAVVEEVRKTRYDKREHEAESSR